VCIACDTFDNMVNNLNKKEKRQITTTNVAAFIAVTVTIGIAVDVNSLLNYV